MEKVKSPASPGFAILTILAILFFFAVVAILIGSNDTSSDVAAVAPPATAPPSASADTATGIAPLSGVATGGGGTADDPANVTPLVVAGLVGVTMLGTGAVVVRRREA